MQFQIALQTTAFSTLTAIADRRGTIYYPLGSPEVRLVHQDQGGSG